MSVPIKGVAFTFDANLVSQSSPNTFKTSPTLASGDVKVSKDGGATANITTLPSESPASSGVVKVDLSATEMDADRIVVFFEDASGAEWFPVRYTFQTVSTSLDQLVAHSGTAQSGTSTTIRLASGASSTDDFYNSMSVVIASGTGAGQVRAITDYTGSTRDATVAAWVTNPDSTSVYKVLGRIE